MSSTQLSVEAQSDTPRMGSNTSRQNRVPTQSPAMAEEGNFCSEAEAKTPFFVAQAVMKIDAQLRHCIQSMLFWTETHYEAGSHTENSVGTTAAVDLRRLQYALEKMQTVATELQSLTLVELSKRNSHRDSCRPSCGVTSSSEAVSSTRPSCLLQDPTGPAAPTTADALCSDVSEPLPLKGLRTALLKSSQRYASAASPLVGDCYLLYVEFKRQRVQRFTSQFPVEPSLYVMVPGDRGYDCGLVICCAKWSGVQQAVDKTSIESIGGETEVPDATGSVREMIQVATEAEVQRLFREQPCKERLALQTCQNIVSRLHLQMDVLDCEYQFDGSKVTYFFFSDYSIDFRELNRELFRIFSARIWLVNLNTAVQNHIPREKSRRMPRKPERLSPHRYQ